MRRKKELEEQVVQKFPCRCPYCDQPVSYDQFDLKIGENEIRCPSCKGTYIKVVSNFVENRVDRSTPLRRRKGIKGGGR
jgi:Zn finger protein HypA/HybF involved in hydrogenase expression